MLSANTGVEASQMVKLLKIHSSGVLLLQNLDMRIMAGSAGMVQQTTHTLLPFVGADDGREESSSRCTAEPGSPRSRSTDLELFPGSSS
jgi:hypothetical protein